MILLSSYLGRAFFFPPLTNLNFCCFVFDLWANPFLWLLCYSWRQLSNSLMCSTENWRLWCSLIKSCELLLHAKHEVCSWTNSFSWEDEPQRVMLTKGKSKFLEWKYIVISLICILFFSFLIFLLKTTLPLCMTDSRYPKNNDKNCNSEDLYISNRTSFVLSLASAVQHIFLFFTFETISSILLIISGADTHWKRRKRKLMFNHC